MSMYNKELLNNNLVYESEVRAGEIWYIKTERRDIIDKSRPVLIMSNEETANTGIITCVQITTKHHHQGTIPIMINGSISFVVPYQEYTMTYNELFTYGTRWGALPDRIYEMILYSKLRIYGTERSEEHEKSLFDYSIGIFRKLLSKEIQLTRSGCDLSPEIFLGGRFLKIFNKDKNRKQLNQKHKKPNVIADIKEKEYEEPITEKQHEDDNNDLYVVYEDKIPDDFPNQMGIAIAKAFSTTSNRSVADKKREYSKEQNRKLSRNKHQKKLMMNAQIENQEVEIKDKYEQKEKINNDTNISERIKPYSFIDPNDNKLKLKRVNLLSIGEKSLLLNDIYHKKSYTKFGDIYNTTAYSVKQKAINCIKSLDTCGLEIPDGLRTYFTTDQRTRSTTEGARL